MHENYRGPLKPLRPKQPAPAPMRRQTPEEYREQLIACFEDDQRLIARYGSVGTGIRR